MNDSVKIVVHSPFVQESSVIILINRSRTLEGELYNAISNNGLFLLFILKYFSVYTESHGWNLFPPAEMHRLMFVHQALHDIHPSKFPCYSSEGRDIITETGQIYIRICLKDNKHIICCI